MEELYSVSVHCKYSLCYSVNLHIPWSIFCTKHPLNFKHLLKITDIFHIFVFIINVYIWFLTFAELDFFFSLTLFIMHYVKTYTGSDFRPFYYITYVNINYIYYKVVVFLFC